MRSNLKHRSPDGLHIVEGDGWALGHGLLQLISKSRYKQQPLQIGAQIFTADARIDNRESVMERLMIDPTEHETITDPELLLRSYIQYGPDFVKDIYGAFAFAIWDTAKKELFIARDHVGAKPVLYAFQDGRFKFSTEMKALVELPFLETEVNEAYIRIHSSGYTTGHTSSCWTNVNRIPPATYVKISASGVQEIQYWCPANRERRTENKEERREKLGGRSEERGGQAIQGIDGASGSGSMQGGWM
jgi:asparagine synthase (glutamine-hydrolysing)